MKAFIGLLILCGTYSIHAASVRLPQSSPCDAKEDGVLIPVPGQCSQFYICLNSEAILSDCGNELHFEADSQTCIEASRSLCDQNEVSDVLEPSSKEQEPEKPIILNSICTGKAIGALVPSKSNCNEFYVCLGSKPMVKTCQVGQHFSPDSGSCIAAEFSNCVSKVENPVEEVKNQIEPQVIVEPIKAETKVELIGHQEQTEEVAPAVDAVVIKKKHRRPKKGAQTLVKGQQEIMNPETRAEVKRKQKRPQGEAVVAIETEHHHEQPQKVATVEIMEKRPHEVEDATIPKQSQEEELIANAEIPKQSHQPALLVKVGTRQKVEQNEAGHLKAVPAEVMEKHEHQEHHAVASIHKPLEKVNNKQAVLVETPNQENQESLEKTEISMEVPSKQSAPVGTTMFAETVCLDQPNGAMFPAPGSCSKYFACLKQMVFEQTCGQRHFDPSTRTCIDAEESKCVEGEVVGSLAVVLKAVESPVDDVVDTEDSTEDEDLVLGNTIIQTDNSEGIVREVNFIREENHKGAQSIEAAIENVVPSESASKRNKNVGKINADVVIENANLSINNTGSISNANIVTGSKDISVGNTDLGSFNTYTVSGGKLIANNKTILIKQPGLPVNKKTASPVEKLDVGIVDGPNGVWDANDNDTDVDAEDVAPGRKGIIIGNANIGISNSGIVSDINIVSGTSDAVVGNTNLGYNNQVQVDLSLEDTQGGFEKENKEIVLAVVDEDSKDACIGVASGTLLPKIGSCREFLTCENGVAFIAECPRGLHFNAKAKFCDWPEFAGCV